MTSLEHEAGADTPLDVLQVTGEDRKVVDNTGALKSVETTAIGGVGDLDSKLHGRDMELAIAAQVKKGAEDVVLNLEQEGELSDADVDAVVNFDRQLMKEKNLGLDVIGLDQSGLNKIGGRTGRKNQLGTRSSMTQSVNKLAA